MPAIENELYIKSRTTGFASPAEAYVDKRLDLNELIIKNVHTTFYFKYLGPDIFGVKGGSTLVIDKSVDPIEGDLVVLTEKESFKLKKFNGETNLWGRVSWILNECL
jgi:DNA polymerase V